MMKNPARSPRWPALLVWSWLAVLLLASVPSAARNLAYVGASPAAAYYRLILLAFCGFVLAYLFLRERSSLLRRTELPVIAMAVGSLFLWRAFVPFILALWLLVLSAAAGGWFFGRLGGARAGLAERLVLWPALGLGMTSVALWILGELRLYYRPLLLALLVLASLLLRRRLGSWAGDVRRTLQALTQPDRFRGPLGGAAVIFLGASLLLSAAIVLTPEVSFDPMVTHLYEARYYAEHHAFQPPPNLGYHFHPKNVEMIQTLGFVLHSQAAAQATGYLYTPLLLGAVFLLAHSWFPAGCPLLAVTLGLGTPLVLLDGSFSKNDAALALYGIVALHALLRWRQTEDPAWARAFAALLGFSFGVKHVAIVGGLPLGLMAACLVWTRHRHWKDRGRAALALAVLTLACGFFWHVRTLVHTGSVIYPLGARRVAAERSPTLLYRSVPYRMFYDPRYMFREGVSQNPLGFTLIGLLPFLLISRRQRNPATAPLLFFAAGQFLFFLVFAQNLRFLISALLVMLVVSAHRFGDFWRVASLAARSGALAILLYCLLFSFQIDSTAALNVPRLRFLGRQIDREQYLSDVLPVYPAISFLNRTARPGERVYSVLACTPLYSRLPLTCRLGRTSEPVLPVAEVPEVLGRGDHAYAIVPAREAQRIPAGGLERIFADGRFEVFRQEGSGRRPAVASGR
jgi:hypothetical protein